MTIMKKVLFTLVALFVLSVTAVRADNDKPIQVSEMPQAAQNFIRAHFSGVTVALAKAETGFLDKSYEVIFSNGSKVEFDKKGIWTEVDCKQTEVPASVLSTSIRNYVSANHPSEKVLKIERDRGEYEVKLSGGLELTFDSKYRLIDIGN